MLQELYREKRDGDFLLYTDRARGDLAGNWLADIEVYGEHFQADYQSMLLSEIGAADTQEIRSALKALSVFFRAKDRIARYRTRVPETHTKEELALGALSVVLKSGSATTESVICAFAAAETEAIEDGAEAPVLTDLDKYGLRGLFERFVAGKVGYEGDLGDAASFLRHLLLTALAAALPQDCLTGLEAHISQPCAEFAMGVAREWMRADGDSPQGALYRACRYVEESCNLPERFDATAPARLADADVFPCIDECVLRGLMTSMAEGADRREDAREALRTRKNLHWYGLFADYYRSLEAAVEVQDFHRTHADGFHLGKASDVWAAYTGDWWHMDSAYRRFCSAYQASTLDISPVDDAAHALSDRVDSVYTNWFLADTNSCWVDAAAGQWESSGAVQGIPWQGGFFNDEVLGIAGGTAPVVVGVADAMRYEVAQELAERLAQRTRGQAEVGAMQSVFPSETKYGMAALLPHKSLSIPAYDGDDVLADGMSTKGLTAREAVLRKGFPGAKCVQFTDLIAMTSSEQKELAHGAEVVYVFQNTIDAAGHQEHGGQDVFRACDDAIDNMCTLAAIATKNMGARHVVFTADHGFLYTHRELTEMEMSSKAQVDGETLRTDRRYIVAAPDSSPGALLDMYMGDMDGGRWAWYAARGCHRIKAAGSKNYVHGGVSLQERCVPVVRFLNARSGTKAAVSAAPATIRLLSTGRRISNTVFGLDLYQKEPVGDKVTAAEYELVFTDDSGNEVSDTRAIKADMAAADERQRVMRAKFTLKTGRTWSAKDRYYLVCRARGKAAPEWKEPFTIDVPFAPPVDFDF